MKTKQDLLQNLGRLRGRRRSVREIERKEELEGLMYVKSGDTVKLVNTSKGDEQAKEQRKIRRTSRKESHEKIKIEGDTVSARGETELTAIQESPRSPNTPSKFGFTKESDEPQKTMNVPTTREDPPKTRIWQPPPRTEPSNPGPAARQWSDPGPQRRPNSFLPPKKDVSFMLLPRGLYSVNSYSLANWLAVRVKVVYIMNCFTLGSQNWPKVLRSVFPWLWAGRRGGFFRGAACHLQVTSASLLKKRRQQAVLIMLYVL